MGEVRTAALAESLARVEERIVAACAASGRDRDDVHLVVVTKFFPLEDVRRLIGLGVTDVGENKAQEAAAKLAGLGDDERDALTVHFVGQLQTNKARQVASWADVVHTVDRSRLVTALDRGAEQAGRDLDVLLQVDLDDHVDLADAPRSGRPRASGSRGGAPADGIPALADEVGRAAHLHLRGVMAVAPLSRSADDAGPSSTAAVAFAELARLADQVRSAHPRATMVSAGMSGDLEQAIAHGATHLRVGSAILGPRPAPR